MSREQAGVGGLKVLGGVLLVLAMVFTMGVSPASAYEPPHGAVFNRPRPWGGQAAKYRIIRTVEHAINHTRPTAADPHPVIVVSSFLFDLKSSADALIRARNHHVSVRVTLDGDVDNHQQRRLSRALNRDNHGRISSDPATWGKDRSYVMKCRGACRGAGGNMHSKFYLFSHTGSTKNVTMISSSNLNKGGAVAGWNDLYIIKRRPKTFQAFSRIHRDMTDDVAAGVHKVQVDDGPFVSRFFPMKNASKANDPTLNDLNHIRCRGSDFGRTRINVSMFYWAGKRGTYLAHKLLGLARHGCRVAIIYGAPSKEIRLLLSKAARRHLVKLYDSRWDLNHNGDYDVRTHGKYVLVKGTYRGDRHTRIAMTGSQNWVGGSLSRGDEVTVNVKLASAYYKYIRNWGVIRDHSRRIPQHR
jgi:hypothetical protein